MWRFTWIHIHEQNVRISSIGVTSADAWLVMIQYLGWKDQKEWELMFQTPYVKGEY